MPISNEIEEQMRYDLAEKRNASYEARESARKGDWKDTYGWVSSNLGQEEHAKLVWQSLLIDDLTESIKEHSNVVRQANKSSDYLGRAVKWCTIVMAVCSVLQLLPHK